MQNDNELRDMIQKYGEANASSDFTYLVMKRIRDELDVNSIPLWKKRPLQIAAIAFIFISIILFIASNYVKSIDISSILDLRQILPLCSKIVYFLITFWVVLLGNYLWKKDEFLSGLTEL